MGTRVYANFPSAAQEAAFLGIDDYDAVERRLEIYQRQLDASFYSAEDQGISIWEIMRLDDEVSELRDLRLYGFERIDESTIPKDKDPSCDGVPIDHPDAIWILNNAGRYLGIHAYGFPFVMDALERLRSCGCTEIYWA